MHYIEIVVISITLLYIILDAPLYLFKARRFFKRLDKSIKRLKWFD